MARNQHQSGAQDDKADFDRAMNENSFGPCVVLTDETKAVDEYEPKLETNQVVEMCDQDKTDTV